MIRNSLVAALLGSTLLAASVAGQTFTSPPDTGTYQARQATYAAGTTLNVLGDGSDAKGGIAPAFTTHPEPADPRPTIAVGSVVTDNTITTCTQPAQCDAIEPANKVTNPNGFQKKSRFEAGPAKFLFDDPIRFYGRPGASHCHLFFGNTATNARSTHASLRLRGQSTASGRDANETGYWVACTEKTINGKTYAIKPYSVGFYYNDDVGPGTPIVDDVQYLHSLLRFVWGVHIDDPDRTKEAAEIAAANAQPGTAGRYSKIIKPEYLLKCLARTGQARALKAGISINGDGVSYDSVITPQGTDPWEGRCGDGDQIEQQSDAPSCWDGWNVSSPNGYDHFRDPVWDNVANKRVCPNGWYKVPAFIPGEIYDTRGPADYMTWSLASDAMMQARLTELGTPRTVRPFQSKHFDWMNGWHHATLKSWVDFCIKAPRTCETNVIGANQRLVRPASYIHVDTNNPAELQRVDTTRQPSHSMKGM